VVRDGRSGGDVDTARAERADGVVDGPAALPLVRAAAALRWSRPDLTAILAELALDAAPDARTWVAAAGWLLHGRAALGDGRETARELLDGLARWGDAAVALMSAPDGRRLRVELAGPARRIGETAVARSLLAATIGGDDVDLELRADVLTELARCAVDDAPDAVDQALAAAEAAWRAAESVPGVASVTLLRAAWSRRAGRAEVAAAEAVDGLTTMHVRGRRAGTTASDHVAAALTAEWIAALVDAGRIDEARSEGVAAATRLVDSARPSRQVAGLRLAIARVTAVEGSPDAVLAALEPAAQVAADSNVPELESACRSMLGELHEAAGGLDAALAALRAAMSADRRDRERAAQLRTGLTAATTTWALRSSGDPAGAGATRGTDPTTSLDGAAGPRDHEPNGRTSAADVVGVHVTDGRGETVDPWHGDPPSPDAVGSRARRETPNDPAHPGGPAGPGAGTGRRARRLVAEALEQRLDTSATLDGGPDEDRRAGRGPARAASGGRVSNGHVPNGHVSNGHLPDGHAADGGRVAATGPTRRSVEPAGGSVRGATSAPGPTWGTPSPPGAVHAAYRTAGGGGSLIGDALLHELAGGSRPGADGVRSSTDRSAAAPRGRTDGERLGTAGGSAAHDPLFGPIDADGSRGPDGPGASRASANGAGPGSGGAGGSTAGMTDSRMTNPRSPRSPRRERPAGGLSYDDTVVLGMRVNGQADPPTLPPGADGGGHAADDTSGAARPARGGPSGRHGGGPDGPAPGPPPSASGGGRNDSTADGAADPHGPARPDVPDTADGSRRARRGTSGRGPGRPPSTDTDGLGLADLLAGALAAYRDL
jgi:hypothetical protein